MRVRSVRKLAFLYKRDGHTYKHTAANDMRSGISNLTLRRLAIKQFLISCYCNSQRWYTSERQAALCTLLEDLMSNDDRVGHS